MGQYGSDGWWQPDDDSDYPPGGVWKQEQWSGIDNTTGNPSSFGGNFSTENRQTSTPMPGGESPDNTMGNPSSFGNNFLPENNASNGTAIRGGNWSTPTAGGEAGLDPAEAQWRAQYLLEHGGVPPRNWDEQREIRDASVIWAAKHGNNPIMWGNKVGDPRVPREIFERISSARRSPDVGTKGMEAWGDYADKMGGALMAMRGQRYHPVEATGEGTATGTKNALLQAIIGALRK